MDETSHWFFVVIEGEIREESLIAQRCYYAKRALLGEAIECALLDAAGEPDFLTEVAPVYVSLVEEHEMEGELCSTAFEDLITTDELFVRPESEGRSFRCPEGIVPTGWQPDEVDREDLAEGFAIIDQQPENSVITVQMEQNRAANLLHALIGSLGGVDGFVVAITNHYDSIEFVQEPKLQENESQTLFIEFSKKNAEQTMEHLEALEEIVLKNGHVDIGINSYDADCTIWFTEHKSLQIVTSDEKVVMKLAAVLVANQLSQLESIPTFADKYSHFHYRPAESLNQKEFVEALENQGWSLES